MLVALILAKFAIVAVLALGGAALVPANGASGALDRSWCWWCSAPFAPWALLRLLPLAELAAAPPGRCVSRRGSRGRERRGTGGARAVRRTGWARALTRGDEAMSAAALHADPRDGRARRIARPASRRPRSAERVPRSGRRRMTDRARAGGSRTRPAVRWPSRARASARRGGAGPGRRRRERWIGAGAAALSGGGADRPPRTAALRPARTRRALAGTGAMWQHPTSRRRPLELGGACPPPPDWCAARKPAGDPADQPRQASRPRAGTSGSSTTTADDQRPLPGPQHPARARL